MPGVGDKPNRALNSVYEFVTHQSSQLYRPILPGVLSDYGPSDSYGHLGFFSEARQKVDLRTLSDLNNT